MINNNLDNQDNLDECAPHPLLEPDHPRWRALVAVEKALQTIRVETMGDSERQVYQATIRRLHTDLAEMEAEYTYRHRWLLLGAIGSIFLNIVLLVMRYWP